MITIEHYAKDPVKDTFFGSPPPDSAKPIEALKADLEKTFSPKTPMK